MLFALTILLCQALAIQASFLTADKPGDDIEALCARKSIDLTTFEQLKALEQGSHGSADCSDTTKGALGDLVRIIGSGMEDLCSVESVENLRSFYAQYLDTSVDAHRDEKLPKSLRRFAIAYGLQMSNYCKRNVVQTLSKRGHEMLSKEDFDQLAELTDDKGPVARMLNNLVGSDDFFTPGDLALLIKGSREENGASEEIFMQTSTGPYVRKLQAVCARRFRPIYEPLIMPVSRLVNRGFNYRDEALRGSLESPDVAHEVSLWARIVFVCESFNSIHIVEDHTADKDAAAEEVGGNLVRIVTAQEAAAIEGTQSQIDGPNESSSLEMAVFTPEKKVLLGNEIYDKKNKALVAAVKSFKTSKTEQEIFKRKLLKKSLSMIGQEVREGHFKFLISTGYKGLLQHFKGDNHQATSGSTPSLTLVKTLNDIQANKAEHPDGAVSSVGDITEWDEYIGNVKARACFILFVVAVVGSFVTAFVVG